MSSEGIAPLDGAQRLDGLRLDGGWTVTKRVEMGPKATGGNFSIGYLVERGDGQHGFLKAMNLMRAFRVGPDFTRVLESLLKAFNFEADLLQRCSNRRMSRVVQAVASGEVAVEGCIVPVPYLIFELADGDVRAHLDVQATFDTAWALRSLHQVAVGMAQLHRADIAHQDLKPSNVLTFEAGRVSKIADLGRSCVQGQEAPHEQQLIAGDPLYAPIELLYGREPRTWAERRRACDLYHLGSLLLFFFAGANTTAALQQALDSSHWPGPWTGDFEEVLPYLREAFDLVAEDLRDQVTGTGANEVVSIFRELCEPDPGLRGNPKLRNRPAGMYALDRYISRFDVLARRAEAGYLRRSA